MTTFRTILLVLTAAFFSGLPAIAQEMSGPIKVEIRQDENGYQLYRGGKPYYVNGVGGQVFLDEAVECGANSIRTWGYADAAIVLDEAHEKGLSVLFGLWVGQERQGFDYSDSKAVRAQFEQFRAVVRKYKDHPAVLMWGIGNENDLMYSDYRVWDAINDIAKMIHEEDPNHPTMTVTAGIDVAEVQLIKDRAPHIDIYGINTYGGLIGIDKEIRSYGWEGPYMITEWGPNGHWEVPTTEWGAPIEQSSSVKADYYRKRYELGIAADRERCIGSYVFLWGNKQETTPTWYGVFLPGGEETEVIDNLQQMWSGNYPENRAPHISSLKIDGKEAIENVYLRPGKTYSIVADITDPEKDPLLYNWQILESEFGLTGSGGDAEKTPDPVKIRLDKDTPHQLDAATLTVTVEDNGTLTFKAPSKVGAYRFFIYAYDGNGNAAAANIPFYVK
ncbi:MAG: glycoside hydrolase family 2 TIM barrel-domain containing protein [Bacteroidota bacterium]